MFATAILLVSLLSGADIPAEKPAAPPIVDAGLVLRVTVPILGQAAVADKQMLIFAFYLGMFR